MQAPADLPSYPSQRAPSSRPMIVTTTENIPEARVVKTLARCSDSLSAPQPGRQHRCALKSLVGGEIKSYVKLNEDARRQALDRHGAKRCRHGANAVTMMRFDSPRCRGA